MAATHSYNAVPSMFMVAPKGNTNELVRLDTPAFYSTQSIVNGSVPEDDAVEKAVSRAGAIKAIWR